MTYSSASTTLLGYKFSNGLALVNVDTHKPKPVFLNKKGKIAFRMPKILRPYTKRDYTPVMATNFYQGLACFLVHTNVDNNYDTCKIVYINTKGKIVLESANIKY
jgi:hypothetical protein